MEITGSDGCAQVPLRPPRRAPGTLPLWHIRPIDLFDVCLPQSRCMGNNGLKNQARFTAAPVFESVSLIV